MTWEIVVGLIALIGCAISLGGVLAKLVRALTRLEVTISTLETTLAELKSGTMPRIARYGTRLKSTTNA